MTPSAAPATADISRLAGGAVAPYFALDIETTNGRPEDAEAWARNMWTPARNWKPETIGRRYLETVEKKEERLALLDVAPVIAISVRTPYELVCMHAMGAAAPEQVQRGVVVGYADEKAMLTAFRALMDERVSDPSIPLVGHNILGFDLRKLRWRFMHHGLRLPAALAAREQATYDTMQEYGKRFSVDRDVFCSLSSVLEAFGLDSHKDLVDGSTVPDLHAAGDVATIVRYALLDVLAESDLYLRMTGQASDTN